MLIKYFLKDFLPRFDKDGPFKPLISFKSQFDDIRTTSKWFPILLFPKEENLPQDEEQRHIELLISDSLIDLYNISCDFNDFINPLRYLINVSNVTGSLEQYWECKLEEDSEDLIEKYLNIDHIPHLFSEHWQKLIKLGLFLIHDRSQRKEEVFDNLEIERTPDHIYFTLYKTKILEIFKEDRQQARDLIKAMNKFLESNILLDKYLKENDLEF